MRAFLFTFIAARDAGTRGSYNSSMINRRLTVPIGCFLITLLFATLANAQRSIPFRIAFVDPTAKFSFADWPVLGRFEGTVEITNDGKRNLLKIRLTGGELIASKSPGTVLAITPFLAKPTGKSFKRVEMAAPALLRKTLDVGIPLKLAPYEFVIDVNESEDLAKRWLAFQVRLECPYPACYIYAHSAGDFFAK